MAIAYTKGPITYRDLRGDTVANLLTDLHTALTDVNWVASTISGGHLYSITTPQGLQCDVRIYNSGDDRVTVQFVSSDGASEGYLHKLDANSTYDAVGYQIIANQCQMFVSLPGITTEGLSVFERNYSVAGGIPYVAILGDDCAASAGPAAAVSDVFWSCGQENNEEFRTSRYCSGVYTTCWNGSLHIATVGEVHVPSNGALQLYPFTMTESIDEWYRTLPHVVKYGSGDPMRLNPFIGWDFVIRGQLWDAFLVSRDTSLEDVLDEDGFTWLAWNYGLFAGGQGGGGTYFATLYLLTDDATGGVIVNYAY